MSRPLTPGEEALARGVFGDAIDYAPVRLSRRKWVFFQPRNVAMTPCGAMHFHPRGDRRSAAAGHTVTSAGVLSYRTHASTAS